jgi:hypothetical protein
MSRLSTLAQNPRITNYAQGKAQSATAPVADFLAPSVEVSSHKFRYWEYDAKNRFVVPNTKRTLGGPAAQIRPSGREHTETLEPHALDQPLDDMEIDEAEGMDLLMEAADELAAIGALSHEKEVIELAQENAEEMGDDYGKWLNPEIDPVAQLNRVILQILKAAPFGSMMEIGILFGPNTLLALFEHPKVRAHFAGVQLVAPSEENLRRLLMSPNGAGVQIRTSFMVIDTAAAGKAQALDFLFNDQVLVFARMANPTKRDPSFMKTFRRRGKWMVPSTVRLPDDRGELVKFDWYGAPKVTNADAARIINVETEE